MLTQTFEKLYKEGTWGEGSGFGSSLNNTIELREFLTDLVNNFSIASIKDLGCGDFFYLSNTQFINEIDYFGYDIVPFIIEQNKIKYETTKINFFCVDILENFPTITTDLTLIKDVLQHLSFKSIDYIFKNLKDQKILVVEDFEEKNRDINNGSYRGLNLTNLYGFSTPLFLYSTYCRQNNYYRSKAVYMKRT